MTRIPNKPTYGQAAPVGSTHDAAPASSIPQAPNRRAVDQAHLQSSLPSRSGADSSLPTARRGTGDMSKAVLSQVVVRDLQAQVAQWSKGAAAPAGYALAAERMQSALTREWNAALQTVDVSQRQKALDGLVEMSNQALGKEGHAINLKTACAMALASEGFSALLAKDEHSVINEAVRYLNLCDSSPDIPVATMAGHAPFAEIKPLLDKRAAVAADRLQQSGAASSTHVIDLVREHKNPQSASDAAQFLRLMDAATAMAAKPSFNKDGSLKAIDITEKLAEDQGQATNKLFEAVNTFVRSGQLQECVSEKREADLYVR